MSTAHRTIPSSSRSAAHFATRWLPPSTAIVTAHGEVDAANADELFAYAASHSGRMTQLVLDLTGVEFFGTAGFSALHTLNARCAADAVEWVLVPSPAVNRLLFICDPESALPVQPTIEVALGEPPRLLQLVAELR
ncbi:MULTISPECIES: STAS domain-containing protein [unclassified Mycobacterium]|uniref:STAS domain-containing protein n=1 Tax=unclassified Mycobacterium TaxID=2642494 RepID=UPI0029C68B73|nr:MULTISPECIES: STAS domain-containing protein [unclassified Mycobacterium]